MATGTQAPKSGIDFARQFGSTGATADRSAPRADRPAAQFWLNIGLIAKGAGEDGEDRFISLPVGIPLDTQEHVKTSSKNEAYRQFMSARNDLLDQLVEVAQTLQPGEDRVFGDTSGLCVQLRRIAEEQSAVESDSNPFAVKLAL